MLPSLRLLLAGRNQGSLRRYPVVAVALFAVTFFAYANGVFEHPGGVVFVPWDAAKVGVVAAAVVGYRRDGLAVAWLVAYAPLLGSHADHAFVGLPRRSFPEQLAYFFGPDGLAFLAVEAIALGTIAFAGGAVVNWCFEFLRGRTVRSPGG